MHLSRHFLAQPHDAFFDNSVKLGRFFGSEEKTITFLLDLELAAASPFHPYKTQRESEWSGWSGLFEKQTWNA